MKNNTPKKKSGVGRLLELAGQKRWLLAGSGFLAVLHVLLGMIPYALMYWIIQSLLMPQPELALVHQYLFWAAVSVLISYVLLFASGMASHIAAFNILYTLRMQMAEKVGKLPLGYLNNRNSGELKKILSDDIERIENFIAHGIPDFIKGLTLPVFVLLYLFFIDWRMALISCLPLAIIAIWVPLVFSSPKNKKVMGEYHRALEAMNAGIVEFVRAMPVMKIFGQSADSFDKYSGTVKRFDRMVLTWMKRTATPWAVFMSFISNAMLPVLLLGTYLYFSNGVSLPVFLLFLILGVGYIKPLFALSNLGSQVSMINHGVQRLDEVLFNQDQEIVLNAKEVKNHSIEFEEVSFHYENQFKALEHVSFQIPQGTVTALVGPSGSGKSTIGQLIAGFWACQKGRILMGGVDLKNIPPEDLMKKVSFVFQDNFLFQETIYENIRMGMDKGEAEVIAAAQAAQCHGFIGSLPKGYQTRIGEGGVHLSGGEQQRIQLARAILKNAPVLVLDEATAFSDPDNESKILDAFNQLIQNKTVIVIAHRLSTIKEANQIIVLEEGQISGKGSHESLIKHCGLYQKMWEAHQRANEFEIILQ
ncbi:ABC transporter ATP-binding protein [Rapidithrix thailandica]|uniref:ABC transporter ATP-binding protein n=1 Tax=Rapidithrix thailandica TaxID=413964 RepID=A0AAW9S614_9BACT